MEQLKDMNQSVTDFTEDIHTILLRQNEVSCFYFYMIAKGGNDSVLAFSDLLSIQVFMLRLFLLTYFIACKMIAFPQECGAFP